jgi:phosphoribosylaminoimidazole (AIR) synthetase
MLHKDYDRKGSVEKKMLVVSLKGLGGKTNWLAVNRQSLNNSGSDVTLCSVVDIITVWGEPVTLYSGASTPKMGVKI